MNRKQILAALTVLVTLTSVPVLLPVGAATNVAGSTHLITNGVLHVTTLVQASFIASSNVVYTLSAAPSPGGDWEVHPSCDRATFDEGHEYKLWDNPDNMRRFFKLQMDEDFSPVTPQPSAAVSGMVYTTNVTTEVTTNVVASMPPPPPVQ